MKPESLLGITLELIEVVALPGAYPADARVGRFFRERRYLGSRDRRFLGDAVFGWLRRQIGARARLRRWLAARAVELPQEAEIAELEAFLAAARSRPGDTEPAPPEGSAPAGEADAAMASRRLRAIYLLDALALARMGQFPWDRGAAASAARALPLLEETDPEMSRLLALALAPDFLDGLDPPASEIERIAEEQSLPEWLARRLVEDHGADQAEELARALLLPASVDLRVNLRLQKRETVRKLLERESGASVEPTHFSPLGLRLEGRRNLTGSRASRKGWIEVQDEGSQLAALCADPAPGMVVIDACAGSGGKTLLIADVIFREEPERGEPAAGGRIYACDISRAKLRELERRAAEVGFRDGLHIVHIFPAGPLPELLPEADLVLVDAPCTGLGTLRRNPQLKRLYSPSDADGFAERQVEIVERFASRVKPGGRLAFITCSLLRAEGEDVAARIEERHPELRRHPSPWAAARLPSACIRDGFLRLDPVRTRTDGFFVAVWMRAEHSPREAIS